MVNQTKLRCKAVQALYEYLVNKAYGVTCIDDFGEEVALDALRDYWVYTTSTSCDYNCNVLEIERKSNIGCTNLIVCGNKTVNCNVGLLVDTPDAIPCVSINITTT